MLMPCALSGCNTREDSAPLVCTAIDGRADRPPGGTRKDCKALARSSATRAIASSGVAMITTELLAISSRDRRGSLANPLASACSLVVLKSAPAYFALAALRATTRLIAYPALLRAIPSANPKRPAPIIETEWVCREDERECRFWFFLFVDATGVDDPLRRRTLACDRHSSNLRRFFVVAGL